MGSSLPRSFFWVNAIPFFLYPQNCHHHCAGYIISHWSFVAFLPKPIDFFFLPLLPRFNHNFECLPSLLEPVRHKDIIKEIVAQLIPLPKGPCSAPEAAERNINLSRSTTQLRKRTGRGCRCYGNVTAMLRRHFWISMTVYDSFARQGKVGAGKGFQLSIQNEDSPSQTMPSGVSIVKVTCCKRPLALTSQATGKGQNQLPGDLLLSKPYVWTITILFRSRT